VALVFLRTSAGAGLVLQRVARCQLPPRHRGGQGQGPEAGRLAAGPWALVPQGASPCAAGRVEPGLGGVAWP
jgi:hypothetical protein